MNRDLSRKALVGAAGTATVATGVVLLVLPGPGMLLIAGGLALLGREFPAAGRILERVRAAARQASAQGRRRD